MSLHVPNTYAYVCSYLDTLGLSTSTSEGLRSDDTLEAEIVNGQKYPCYLKVYP